MCRLRRADGRSTGRPSAAGAGVTAARGGGAPRLVRALSLAFLAAATFVAFAGVLRNGWMLLDDPLYVTQNPYVTSGPTVRGLLWFLHAPHGGNWHPLTSLSHMVDVRLFGLAPAGHHAVNLALHLLNVLLLVIVLHRLTGAWWRSLLVGALFGLHPLRVESVAWVAERKDVLSGLFFLLTLEAWRRWAARPAARRYALVVAGLALGLMSKPMLVTLPFVLVLLDVWPLGRLRGGWRPVSGPRAGARPLAGLIAEKWPLFVLAGAVACLTFLIQRQSGAVVAAAFLGLPERVGNALLSYWRYVGMTLWPAGLSPFCPLPAAVDPWAVVAAAAGLVVVTVLALREGRERPYLAVGWFWYVGMLVPVIGLVQVGIQGHADRYTYLPVIGLLVAAVWGLSDLFAGRRRARRVAAAGAVLVLAALGVASARQVALWKDTRTLFTHARRVTGENVVVDEMLGMVSVLEGRTEEGLALLRRGVALAPADSRAQLNLAAALLALRGHDTEAAEHLRLAVRHGPASSEALNGLAWLLATSPDPAVRDGREAERLAELALKAGGDGDPSLLDTQAAAQAAAGRSGAAVATARRALDLAKRAGIDTLAAAIRGRLAAFERGGTWVDSARVAGTLPGRP